LIPFTTAAEPPIPIVDAHIHLFDPRRPEGIPWPDKNNPVLYKPTLPSRLREVAQPLGIVGAIEIECSPRVEDNQWVLDVAARDPIIVGTVGDLEPDNTNFAKQLERFHRNPLFRGIRYGNLWNRDLTAALTRPEFISGLKLLAEADLELDTANPTPALIADIVHLTDLVPNLRVVLDHLPHLDPPADSAARSAYEGHLRQLGARPQVYVKISAVLRNVGGRVPRDLSFYRDRLDHLVGVFGEDRVIYGSDWPNSDTTAPYADELKLVSEYFLAKGRPSAEKFFWKNSLAAYRWTPRDHAQPRSL
jgi:L-fuconolactonase